MRWLLDTPIALWAITEPLRLLTRGAILARYSDTTLLLP